MKHIMELNVKNLAKEQYEYLKEHSINILKGIIEDFQNDDLKNIQEKISYSAAGDGYGDENYFINFAYLEHQYLDIAEIIDKMISLKLAFKEVEVDD